VVVHEAFDGIVHSPSEDFEAMISSCRLRNAY
jgi:hypothetical protein